MINMEADNKSKRLVIKDVKVRGKKLESQRLRLKDES